MPAERILDLGAEEDPTLFNMAHMGLRLGQRANGVSVLHGEVSREMFAQLWPGFDTSEVPITSVTNGVHLPTWLNSDLAQLYDQYLAPDWRERHPDPKIWDLIEEIPNQIVITRFLKGTGNVHFSMKTFMNPKDTRLEDMLTTPGGVYSQGAIVPETGMPQT